MFALAQSIAAAGGWRRRLIALAAGAAGALAMAPFDLWPALFAPMTVGVWLIDGAGRARKAPPAATLRRPALRAARLAFADGWWWGFGYFVAGLWWLGAAFLADGGQYALAMPLGVLGLPAAMALYPAAGFALARLVWPRGPLRLFAFAAALTFAEWLRGALFTGFPWNAFGMALGGNLALAQFASVVGLWGLTLLAVLIFAAPATLAEKPLKPRALVPCAVAAAALAGLAGFGALRLAGASDGVVQGVALKILQPNLSQDDKFSPAFKRDIVAGYLAGSALDADAGAGAAGATVLIWPESAFPFILSRDPEALATIAAALPLGVTLVTGAARAEEDPSALADGFGLPPSRLAHPIFFNAIHVIGASGLILDTYDKSHLVPFGEYLPFEAVFARIGLHQFVHVPGGFEAGRGRRALAVPGLPPVAPSICYEAIFPGEVLPAGGGPRPGLLLNVTDDGWFGLTAGPYQHFAQARLRAIEEGLPLLRAANTGISAIIDPYGRIETRLPLGVAGLLRGALPRALPPPPFARHPVLLPLLLWLAAAAVAAAARLPKV